MQFILAILKNVGWFFNLVGRNDLAEDGTLLAGSISALLIAPFDIHTGVTWLAMGAVVKSLVSMGSNLKVKFFMAINVNDLMEDFGFLGGAVTALLVAPIDLHSQVCLLAMGSVVKAAMSILAALNVLKKAPVDTPEIEPVPVAAPFTALSDAKAVLLKKAGYKPTLRVDPPSK